MNISRQTIPIWGIMTVVLLTGTMVCAIPATLALMHPWTDPGVYQ
ncbi:MAG: hypothetical protein WAV20_25760 [Blastocatellia bacterium]